MGVLGLEAKLDMDRSGEAPISWSGRAEETAPRRRLRLIEPMMAAIRHGRLAVRLPNGALLVSPDREGPQAFVAIERWRALRRLATGGDVGFAEAFIDGDWTSPDVVALIRLAALNAEEFRLG